MNGLTESQLHALMFLLLYAETTESDLVLVCDGVIFSLTSDQCVLGITRVTNPEQTDFYDTVAAWSLVCAM